MRRRDTAQSIVEMAIVMPMMLMLIFAIIDFSWYIFGYATVYQAARNGAETASKLPPFAEWIEARGMDSSDPCMNTIRNQVQSQAVLFFDGIWDQTSVSYPNGGHTRNLFDRGPIEVSIRYDIEPLTPLQNLVPVFGNNGVMTVEVATRRSLQGLGNRPGSQGEVTEDDAIPNGIACILPD